jgi:hypothetical protein
LIAAVLEKFLPTIQFTAVPIISNQHIIKQSANRRRIVLIFIPPTDFHNPIKLCIKKAAESAIFFQCVHLMNPIKAVNIHPNQPLEG